MNWNKKKEEKRSTTDVCSELYTVVKTCCECEIYIYIIQTYDYKYTIEPEIVKICDLHKEAALVKHTDKVRSKLV